MDNIIPIVITLLFMAIWAFNLLFNKELGTPARPARPGGPPNYEPQTSEQPNSNDARVRIERDASGRYYIAVDQRQETSRNERERPQTKQRGGQAKPSKKKANELGKPITTNLGLTTSAGSQSIQLTPLDRTKPAAVTTGTTSMSQSALTQSLRETMRSLPKLREAILIREILGPPLALTPGMGRTPPALRSPLPSNSSLKSLRSPNQERTESTT